MEAILLVVLHPLHVHLVPQENIVQPLGCPLLLVVNWVIIHHQALVVLFALKDIIALLVHPLQPFAQREVTVLLVHPLQPIAVKDTTSTLKEQSPLHNVSFVHRDTIVLQVRLTLLYALQDMFV